MCFISFAVSELSWRNKSRFHWLRSCERNEIWKHPAGFFEKIPSSFNISRNICHKLRYVAFKLISNSIITLNELQVLGVSQNTRGKSIFHRSHWPIEDWVRHIRNSSVRSKRIKYYNHWKNKRDKWHTQSFISILLTLLSSFGFNSFNARRVLGLAIFLHTLMFPLPASLPPLLRVRREREVHGKNVTSGYFNNFRLQSCLSGLSCSKGG